MEKIAVLVLVVFVCASTSLPLETLQANNDVPSPVQPQEAKAHYLRRRFINPLFGLGTAYNALNGQIRKIRTKRSYDECEKLRLCKLHARSRVNFFAAYELYFVSKENARLWDHRPRSMADCEQRYGDCYGK